jgi:hypothetical protein
VTPMSGGSGDGMGVRWFREQLRGRVVLRDLHMENGRR